MPITAKIKEDTKMGKQITEWLNKGESFIPKQIMTEKDADEFGWDCWEKRPKKVYHIKNMEWIGSERIRMKQKGIDTVLKERIGPKGIQTAIFSR